MISIETDGIADVTRLMENFPDVTRQAAVIAVNQIARRDALTMARESIYEQIAFPKDYLTGDRLYVGRLANRTNIEATIVARQRPTSLARFATGVYGRVGVTVRVGAGTGAIALRKAWLVRLKNGNAGLALRVKEGETIVGKHSDHKAWLVKNKVALLYGPSVDQVFRSVSGEIAKPVGERLAIEFNRQLERLL